MLTLGFYVRPWIKVDYPEIPSVGRIEAEYFNPDEWKPEYPNAAFRNARADDRFWAARIVAAIPPEAVRRLSKRRATPTRGSDTISHRSPRPRGAGRSWSPI